MYGLGNLEEIFTGVVKNIFFIGLPRIFLDVFENIFFFFLTKCILNRFEIPFIDNNTTDWFAKTHNRFDHKTNSPGE